MAARRRHSALQDRALDGSRFPGSGAGFCSHGGSGAIFAAGDASRGSSRRAIAATVVPRRGRREIVGPAAGRNGKPAPEWRRSCARAALSPSAPNGAMACSTPALRAARVRHDRRRPETRCRLRGRCLLAIGLAGKVDPLDIAPARLDTLRSPNRAGARARERTNPDAAGAPGGVRRGAPAPCSLARLSVSRGTPGLPGERVEIGHDGRLPSERSAIQVLE